MKIGEAQFSEEQVGVIEALASIVTEDADEGDATPDCKTRGDE